MNGSLKLRKLIESENFILAPGAHDALTAAIVSKCGFEAVYLCGYAQAASILGRLDADLLTLTERIMSVTNIVESAEIPVVIDAGSIFESAKLVGRIIRAYENAGVAAVQLDDFMGPGLVDEGNLLPRGIMLDHIKAAADSRQSRDFMIIAQTNARSTLGIGAALDLAGSYIEAGADMIFIKSPQTVGEMKLINESINAYTIINMDLFGANPVTDRALLKEAGYNMVVYPDASIGTTVFAFLKQLSDLTPRKADFAELISRILAEI